MGLQSQYFSATQPQLGDLANVELVLHCTSQPQHGTSPGLRRLLPGFRPQQRHPAWSHTLIEHWPGLQPSGQHTPAATARASHQAYHRFEGLSGIKVDPEMVQLASPLVQRQSGRYDAADLEDKYETRLRAMIDAKLKGEGVDAGEPEVPERTNVVDLMAALKKSLGEEPEKRPAPAKKKAAAAKVTSIKSPQAASAKRKRA